MSQSSRPMTGAEYLAWSERQEMTYEFDGVRPVARNGGTIGHELIQGNLTVITRGDPHWAIEVHRGAEVILLAEIGVELRLTELYAGLELDERAFEDGDPPR